MSLLTHLLTYSHVHSQKLLFTHTRNANDRTKNKKKKKMMMGEMWASNIAKKIEKKGWVDLFHDDSEKMKDASCAWVYTRWGKIVFVIGTFVVLFVFVKLSHPHAQRLYTQNQDEIHLSLIHI